MIEGKRLKRMLADCAIEAHKIELDTALAPIAEAFQRWNRGELNAFELTNQMDDFMRGPEREFMEIYTSRPHDIAVASAISRGVLSRASVPDELYEEIKGLADYFTSERARNSKS
jgi:hypothetical protein